ncbi:hypothetical protein NY2A_b328R [Paramecium bursaria Chlorella virus NY2A]|uniref:Uncharacterized protein b328R n=1 Tax=Paramecium bursaria Chlorella virus NY2A TaxID=46021 RepID=A7IWK3_PBCVN|nr:hypothetical protein NY2A_b328R [Paramecium bursaria Chlorella virus NY2A]ABT14727.1 hypothetical protein NY2A_b328R [Paramecium bursaria Chlorella virus NY2A]
MSDRHPQTIASAASVALSNICVSSPFRIIVPSFNMTSRSAVPITGHDTIRCCSIDRCSSRCFFGDAHSRFHAWLFDFTLSI